MTTTVPLTAHVLATVFRAVRDLGLPAPCRYVVDGGRVDLGFRSPAEVDAWQRHMDLPAAKVCVGARLANEYRTSDFPPHGWGGVGVVTISCPPEVSADAAA